MGLDMGAFEQAWQLLKADFSDIAPFPSRHEESYIPDLQEMLELEAIRQTSGQEVPRFLLREPHMGGGAVGIPYPPGSGRSVYDYQTGPRRMQNVPGGFTHLNDFQNLPLTTRPHIYQDLHDRMNFTARVPNQFASVQSMNNEE